MELTEVVEGNAKLLVPAGNKDAGPGTHDQAVFFNPAMATSRDVSLAVYRAGVKSGGSFLDGLAASGARAIRVALGSDLAVTANDWNPKAVELCARNAEANGAKVDVVRRNLPALLWETLWDAVDVDPFGSPAEFVDAAVRSVRRHGLLALCATDATALYGVYPGACERRYLATPMRCEFGHELAIRIVAGFAARSAAKHDVAMTPVLAHATDHFYRVYLRADRGAGRADDALAHIGVAWLCKACADRGLDRVPPDACRSCGSTDLRAAGPLWAGPLFDAGLAHRALAESGNVVLARDASKDLLARLVEEAAAPPLYVDVHNAAGRAGVDVPRMDALVARLAENGFKGVRTHMRDTALRTDATMKEFAGTLASLR